MNNPQFGFGIIGAGMIAHFHAKAIKEIRNAKLEMIYDSNKYHADEFAHQFSCKSCNSLEEMLCNPKIEIICICTPSGAHLEPARAAIAAGKNCLIEKPLEISVERCEKIIQAAKQANVKIGVIFPSRFYKAEKQLKDAMNKKRFGNLVLGDAYVKWYRSLEYYKSGSWRGTWKLDGGGALMNQGIHSVDLLQWYMGPIASVQAISANRLHNNIEVEDTVVCAIQFANGALGSIECSTAAFPGTLKRIEIRGTEGSAVLEEDKLIEWNFREKSEEDESIVIAMKDEHFSLGGVSDPAAISYKGHQWQIEDMMHAIEAGGNPSITADEGKKSVAIIEAIYKSAKTGAKIILE